MRSKELFWNLFCGRGCTNYGYFLSSLKSMLLWPVARRRNAFWQFCLFIILSNTHNYPIKAVSLPLTCFFPCIFCQFFFLLSLNTWITASKGQMNIFRYAEIASYDSFFFSDGLLWLKGSTDPNAVASEWSFRACGVWLRISMCCLFSLFFLYYRNFWEYSRSAVLFIFSCQGSWQLIVVLWINYARVHT